MNKKELKKQWLKEEEMTQINGWDFSYINDRYEEEQDLPWDYKKIIKEYLKKEDKVLDIDTAGGEFLLSLNHPYKNTAATEGYKPNILLCKEKLIPLGIDFKAVDGLDEMPFKDNSFDLIINRHGDFNLKDIYRMLKKGGLFITEQVGAENDRELVELLLGDIPIPYPDLYLDKLSEKIRKIGFDMIRGEEAYRPIKFYDVSALVWFSKIIEWEFIDFSVEKCIDNLYKAQTILEEKGSVDARIHRILLICRKN